MALELALFPIPGCVTFPGTVMPLHVFEPRYRAMVKHCVDNQMPMGICHTRKVLSPAKDGQSVKERLSSNQSTYKPQSVFSAGKCEVMETLDDGRLLIHVHLSGRFKLSRELQSLPFSICLCEPYDDIALEPEVLGELELVKEKIIKRLIVMTNDIPELRAIVGSKEWEEKDPEEFAFGLFGTFNFEADVQQKILEMTSPLERLTTALEIINRA